MKQCKDCQHENECGSACFFCRDGDNYRPTDTRDYDYPEPETEEEE